MWLICAVLIAGPFACRTEDEVRAAPPPDMASFLARVDHAIDHAVVRIRSWWDERARGDAKFRFGLHAASDPRVEFGMDALAALSMLHGLDGLPFQDLPAVLESIRGRWRAADSTYGVAVALMLFSEARRQSDAARVDGSARLRAIPAWVDREAQEMARAISRWRSVGGGWTYGAAFGKTTWDISNTQFAVRSLLEARRFAVDLRRPDADEIRNSTLGLQWETGNALPLTLAPRSSPGRDGYADPGVIRTIGARDRGFHYSPLEWTSAGTTSAALVVLASLRCIELSREPADRRGIPELDAAIRDGLTWLAKRHAPGKNASITRGDDQLLRGVGGLSAGELATIDDREWGTLVLWNVSQLMELLRIDGTGEGDWYREGAEYLIQAQGKDGRWHTPDNQLSGVGVDDAPLGFGHIRSMDEVDTAFALLFLHRAKLRYSHQATPSGERSGGASPSTPR